MHKDKWVAVEDCRGQIVGYEDEAEALHEKIEEGVAKLAQSYSEQKLVLAAIEGDGKETTALNPQTSSAASRTFKRPTLKCSVEPRVKTCRLISREASGIRKCLHAHVDTRRQAGGVRNQPDSCGHKGGSLGYHWSSWWKRRNSSWYNGYWK